LHHLLAHEPVGDAAIDLELLAQLPQLAAREPDRSGASDQQPCEPPAPCVRNHCLMARIVPGTRAVLASAADPSPQFVTPGRRPPSPATACQHLRPQNGRRPPREIMSHRLIVLPDDTAKPILDAIHAAKMALNIRMFLFTDETLIGAVIAAKRAASRSA
jgi:hypothetical protein